MPTSILDLLRIWNEMVVDKGAVSKRSARTYKGDESEKEVVVENQAKPTSQYEDGSLLEASERRTSTSTATSRSSLSNMDLKSQTVLSGTSEDAAERQSKDSLVEMEHHDDNSRVERAEPVDAVPAYPFLQRLQQKEVPLPDLPRPINFGVVVPGVYRSSYPQLEDYPFISELNLKTVVTLVHKDIPKGYATVLSSNGIRHCVFDMKGTKKEEIPPKTMKSILRLVLDRQNYPLLIHCNHGRHRTGVVVAVVRKLSGWQLPDIIDEYKAFAEPKVRECDIKYITELDLSRVSNLSTKDASLRLRLRAFLRATLFSLVVLVIWMVSGSNMALSTRRKLVKL